MRDQVSAPNMNFRNKLHVWEGAPKIFCKPSREAFVWAGLCILHSIYCGTQKMYSRNLDYHLARDVPAGTLRSATEGCMAVISLKTSADSTASW